MFVHLRLHTEFSVVDGTNRIDEVVASAAADGQGALAITDLSNLFGAVKFYQAARSKGVKPLLGAELLLAGPDGATPSGGGVQAPRRASVGGLPHRRPGQQRCWPVPGPAARQKRRPWQAGSGCKSWETA